MPRRLARTVVRTPHRLARTGLTKAAGLSFNKGIRVISQRVNTNEDGIVENRLAKRGKHVMADMIFDIMNRLLDEASAVAKHSGIHGIHVKEMETSVKLMFPGEIGKRALQFAQDEMNQRYVHFF